MAEDKDLDLKDEGNTPEETDEDIAVLKRLSDLNRGGGQVSMTKNDMSLMKGMAAVPPDTKDRYTHALPNGNFIDIEEMQLHISAYDEAVEMGMDTEINIQWMQGLRGTNRRGGYVSNLNAAIFDTLSHSKITSNQPRGNSNSGNKNSPIS